METRVSNAYTGNYDVAISVFGATDYVRNTGTPMESLDQLLADQPDVAADGGQVLVP
jgi:hypothetical protein